MINIIIKRVSTLCLFSTFFWIQTLQTIPRFDPRLMPDEELMELIAESQKEDDRMFLETRSNGSYSVKPMTFMVFIAADNDLHYFAWKNIKQMELIGSNENINIVIQLNTPGHLNPTKRYIIKKGRRVLIQEQEPLNQKINSGSPYSLIDFVDWATKNYPAQDYALVLWNHGTGAVDPGYVKTINPCDLFYCNPSNNTLELDKGIGYLSLILQCVSEERIAPKRGMCFDETFKSYQ